MEQIAFISGDTFIYWSSIILTIAVFSAMAVFVAMYLAKNGSVIAISLTIPLAAAASAFLARLIHWYCRADSYASLHAAITDYSWGGWALMGVFAGCILTACLLRLVRVVKNLPDMLDSMAIAGGVGIAVGRLASFYNTADRGVIVSDALGLPFAYRVTNAVSGVVENRLATFVLQSIVTAVITAALLIWLLVCCIRKKKPRSGDTCLLFLAAYGASQVVLDSTRYDSLFMRSNGFISIVQILGAVAMVTAMVIFSVRMVKARGMKGWYAAFWAGFLALFGGAGYMEYYVQRHGNEALFAYSVMSACLAGMVLLILAVRCVAVWPVRKAAPAELTEAAAAEAGNTGTVAENGN